MRFLVDESTGPSVANWLRQQGHETSSIYDDARGLEDELVIEKAYKEDRILVTNDKDFGEKIYRQRSPHRGVVLLRLEDERAKSKIEAMRRLLDNYADKLSNRFVVVTEKSVRIAGN
jgi:predicted nuclease of predicted toxin-antitoxin system